MVETNVMKRTVCCITLVLGMIFVFITTPPSTVENTLFAWVGFAITLIGVGLGIWNGRPPT